MKRTALRFFLNSCKQKERDIHNIYLYTEIHTEYLHCGTYLLIETHRVSVYTHSPPSHTPTPYIQHLNTNVVSVLGRSRESVCYQMMKYLTCITPEKTEGNDSSEALWNGTIT